jgi:hypothetical protein
VNQDYIQDWDGSRERICRVPGLGIPDRMYMQLPYDFTQYSILNGATSGGLLVAGNSCFDPDKTGAGHQPLYFDQMATLYRRYRVHKSTISESVIYATNGCSLSINPTTDSAYPTTYNEAMEYPYVSYANVPASNQQLTMTSSISSKKMWGVPAIDQDDLFQALYTADPTRLWYWKLHAESFDGITAVTAKVNVKILYEVEFFERIGVLLS